MRLSMRLIVVTLLGILVASHGAGAVTIEYMAWGSNTTLEAHQREAAAFAAKYPDSGIVIEPLISEWNEYQSKMFVQAAAGVLPDIVMVPAGFWPEMAERGYFLDLEPFIERDPDFDPTQLPRGVTEIMRVNNRLYTLPTGGFTPTGAMVAINRDHVEAAGLPDPDIDWTWDEYLQYAIRLTRRDGDRVVTYGTAIGKSTWEGAWAMHIAANGGHLVEPQGEYIIWPVSDPSRLRVNTPVVEQAFQFLKDLVDVYDVSLPAGSDPTQAFTSGLLAMHNAWSGTPRNYLEQGTPRVIVATTPTGAGGHHGVWAHIGLPHAYAISAQTKDPEAAWKVLKFLVSEEEALLARRTQGLGTVAYRPLVQVYERMAPPEWEPWLAVGYHYLNHMPSEGNELWKTISNRAYDALMEEVRKAYNDEQSVRAAVEAAHERIAVIMQEESQQR